MTCPRSSNCHQVFILRQRLYLLTAWGCLLPGRIMHASNGQLQPYTWLFIMPSTDNCHHKPLSLL